MSEMDLRTYNTKILVQSVRANLLIVFQMVMTRNVCTNYKYTQIETLEQTCQFVISDVFDDWLKPISVQL